MRGIDKTTSREALIALHCLAIGSERELRRLALIIKKDLDVLDILKNYLYYDNKNHVIKMKKIRKSTFNFDYEDLKEWLENDSNKNKFGDSKS